MPAPILATKLYIPTRRPDAVPRPRLVERMNEGLHRKLTLVSAAAGFGKTTLVCEWIAGSGRPVAWLSLDEGDNDPARFLTYLIAALRTISADLGAGLLGALQSPQPPATDSILTALLNEMSASSNDCMLVLDDCHLIDAEPVVAALSFLVENLPPRMHLVIATREDPRLPLARLRARGQLAELRAADLRFSTAEAAEFLKRAMDLALSEEAVAALEARTEGWVAGLQLAAISMQGQKDADGFIESFTGSHRFVLDYLMEEVLHRQPESVQTFLLRTSVLERMCGPLCDALMPDPSASGQASLEYLERANLFIVPLDNERCWYRYHHLFAELLRQRLQHTGGAAECHVRASQWLEDNGLEIDAFRHAAAGGDVDRAARLMTGRGMPLHIRGALLPVLKWLESLPAAALDARPVLWVMYAGASTTAGLTDGVEEKLQAAEAALRGAGSDAETRDLIGRIANNRATLAITRYEAETIVVQACRALEYLRPDNLPVRSNATWALGVAHQLKGDRSTAERTFAEAISISRAIGHTFVEKLATTGLGTVLESENKLHLAAETYRQSLRLFGDQPLPFACMTHMGLARILYEWNDLDAARHHAQQSIQLARQFSNVIDRVVICQVFLARLLLARGDMAGAQAELAEADRSVRRYNFEQRMPELAAVQLLALLRRGDLGAAARLAKERELPLSRARVHLARGNPSAALELLEPLRRQMEAKHWPDELFKVMVLQALAFQARGETDQALQTLAEVLALAEPGGFIRSFLDEGPPMDGLLSEAAARGIMPDYTGRLLAAFAAEERRSRDSYPPPLVEPLSQREQEVLRLIAQGLSNNEICERLFIALDTVKGHNRRIFEKLQVQRRTEAVARARELDLL